MIERLHPALSKADPRVVALGMVLIAALVAFEGWHLVLRKPINEYQQLRAKRTGLAAVVAASPREPAELTRLAAEVQSLDEKLKGELRASQSDEQLTTRLVSELDQSAASGGTVLKGVKPGSRTAAGAFEEVAFDVAAEGQYLKVSGWLMDLERVLGPSAAITEINMKASNERQADVTLKLAVYRGTKPAQGK